MVEELFNKTFGTIIPHAEYELVADSPGDTTDVRVILPFYDLEKDESIVVIASYDIEKKLFQISDQGFCCSKLDEKTRTELNHHRNFIRANGFNFNYSSENNFFFVLSPVVGYEDNDVNMPALIGHYFTVLMSYNR